MCLGVHAFLPFYLSSGYSTVLHYGTFTPSIFTASVYVFVEDCSPLIVEAWWSITVRSWQLWEDFLHHQRVSFIIPNAQLTYNQGFNMQTNIWCESLERGEVLRIRNDDTISLVELICEVQCYMQSLNGPSDIPTTWTMNLEDNENSPHTPGRKFKRTLHQGGNERKKPSHRKKYEL